MTAPCSAYLAIDLGASSGRAVIGTLGEQGMQLVEVHRFRTPLVDTHGRLTWDIEALTADVVHSVRVALEREPSLRSVSIDSWGVDYVPLTADGSFVRPVYAYRDPRTAGRMDEAARMIGAARLYAITGIQFMEINTLPQIVADVVDEPDLLPHTATRLLIADYLLYRLSGVAVAERTLASTTQLMDVTSGEWSSEIAAAIGDDVSRWPKIVPPGTVLGPLLSSVSQNDASAVPVIVATCSHDTGAAVAAIPADHTVPWAFISSGTWSLVGAEIDEAIVTPEAHSAGFTNEAGIDDTTRFLKNRMGMWVFEECIREWNMTAGSSAYTALLDDAEHASTMGTTLDLDAPAFARRGDMLFTLATACHAAGFDLPRDRGSVVRLIFESMAASYSRAVDQLDALLGRRSQVIHIVGGGSRVSVLNQLTANACGRRVVAGPAEATALGNLLAQVRALGDLPHDTSIRQLAALSSTLHSFKPFGRADHHVSTTSR